MRRFALGAVLLVGCSPSRFVAASGDTGGAGPTGPVTELGTTGSDASTGSSGEFGEATTAGEESSSGFYDPTTFLQDPDAGSDSIECSIYDQNCPDGEKCMPWANDGGGAWNATRCSPIAEDPGQVDDPCTVEGNGASGIDDCDIGLMCWDVDRDTNEGYCAPMCLGSERSPVCEDPDRICSIGGEGVLALCLARCLPLAQDCPDGQACYPVDTVFVCAPDAGGDDGAYADRCEYLNVCDPGLMCIDAESVPDCDPSFAGCCTPYCNVEAPNDCPGAGQECVPWFEPADTPPGFEDVGVCVLPA